MMISNTGTSIWGRRRASADIMFHCREIREHSQDVTRKHASRVKKSAQLVETSLSVYRFSKKAKTADIFRYGDLVSRASELTKGADVSSQKE